MSDANEEKRPQENNIQIDLDEETAQGSYSNLMITNFSQEEFVLDFVFLQPHLPKGRILSRNIVTPRNAKRLLQILSMNIKEYENKYGPITEDPQQQGINISFN